MTSVRNHVTTVSNTNHENNLDALLEELQTSVSRPGSSLGHVNGPVTGYREVTVTRTTEIPGQPPTKSSEYHIEYLNPSNTTTVLEEHRDHRDFQPSLTAGNQAGYKTVEYKYNTKSSSSSNYQDGSAAPMADVRMRQNITELDSLLDDLHTAQKTGFADSGTSRPSGIDPGLLEQIETSTPKSNHVSRSVEKRTFQEQRYGSVGQNRTSPAREKDVRKELVFTGGKRDQPSPGPGSRQEVYRYETKTTRSGSANSRDLSPPQDRRQPSPSPARQQLSSVRTYNYSSSDDVPRTPTLHRSPSPAGGRNASSTTVRQYNYSTTNNRDFSPEGTRQPYRSPSPTARTPRNYTAYTPPEPPRTSSSKITSNYSTSYNSSSRTQEVPRSPPPHRSPSPVSFSAPPLPTHKTSSLKTYNHEQHTSSTPSYIRPQSPQPAQKFSPSDPSRTLTYQVSPPPPGSPNPTVITYKYSSQTTTSTKYPEFREYRDPREENVPLLPRPFPTPSPTPETQQQPPKKLEELMASFSDTDLQHHESSTRYAPVREPVLQRTEASAPAAPPTPPPPAPHSPPMHHESSTRYAPVREPVLQRTEASAPAAPPTPPPPAPHSPPMASTLAMQNKSKNIAGPPVYYPPGVELFAKKEEAMMQSQPPEAHMDSFLQSGGGKYKAKSKYEYEASSKMKSKESSGKAVVPVCLPVCCAMPCVIM